jgi:alcohol dehydrogenase (cytochrome c)
MPRWLRLTLLALAVLVAAPILLASASDEIGWRLRVLAKKATGGVDQLSWPDLVLMIRPGSGFWLGSLRNSDNAYAAIQNPHISQRDVLTGRALFRANCESCHGSAARGGSAPALVGRDLTHGASDWAIFRSIRDGIAGTPMQAHDYPADETWKLVAYLQQQITEQQHEAVSSTLKALPTVWVDVDSVARSSSAGADWPTYYGSYNGHRYSSLDQINRKNVTQLQTRWMYHIPARAPRIEASPLAAAGRVFLTDPHGSVIALDGVTGRQLWRFSRDVPNVSLCCATANRGVALGNDMLYVGTLDAHLIALDAATGEKKWERPLADYRVGYSSTGAPLVVKDMVIVGIAGSEYGAPGFIRAFDARTGRDRWRAETIAQPGQKGHDTWAGDSWRLGGVSSWMTGTYDPELNLLYWGTGNAAPDYDASARAGDNLYSNSVLALQADTGRLSWYFQYSPGDDHDWDAVQTPVLADVKLGGVAHKVLLSANRNGFFYVLERETGHFVRAAAFVRQNWAVRIDASGRPVRRPEATASERGSLVYPGTSGGTNWWPPTYSPQANLFIVPALERAGLFFRSSAHESALGEKRLGGSSQGTSASHYTAVRALDPETGNVRWEYRSADEHDTGEMSGLLSTAGELLFTSDRSNLIALDIRNGGLLWSFEAGANIYSPPTTYLVGTQQFLVFAAADVVVGMALPPALPSASPLRTDRRTAVVHEVN